MAEDDYNYPQEMDGEQWVEHFWSKDFLPFAAELEPDKFLLKYFDAKGAQGKKGLKVFFPMCGTSPDMKWVAEQGQKVIGCEYAPQAGPLFAENMKLTFAESDDPDRSGKIFQYKEADVKMYCCDIYKFTSSVEGQYDIIWDSAAFAAVNQKDKQQYADLLKSLLKPDGKLFLYAIDYEDGAMKGPPFPVRNEHVTQYFPDFNSELVDVLQPEEHEAGMKCTNPLRLLTFK